MGLTAQSVRDWYLQTELAQTLQQGRAVCALVQPGKKLANLELELAAEGAALARLSPDFALVSKSFCRCGVELDHDDLVLQGHGAWCLN